MQGPHARPHGFREGRVLEGWVKLHRKITEWGWWSSPNDKILFLELLLRANYKPGSWRGIDLAPGQLVTGRKQLSKWTRLSEGEIRGSLKRLKSTQEINQQVTNKFSVITILKWDLYQDKENVQPTSNHQTNQQVTNKSPHPRKQEVKKKEYITSGKVPAVVNYLNSKTGTRYKSSSLKTSTLIKKRISEGFNVDDFKKVIDIKYAEWSHDSKMCKFLRPETLFGTKFESYLNQQEENQIPQSEVEFLNKVDRLFEEQECKQRT